MSVSNGIKVLICCLYKSPNGSQYNNKLLVEPRGCSNFSKFDFICIMGDFIIPILIGLTYVQSLVGD